jgi:hypothetical protein
MPGSVYLACEALHEEIAASRHLHNHYLDATTAERLARLLADRQPVLDGTHDSLAGLADRPTAHLLEGTWGYKSSSGWFDVKRASFLSSV